MKEKIAIFIVLLFGKSLFLLIGLLMGWFVMVISIIMFFVVYYRLKIDKEN